MQVRCLMLLYLFWLADNLVCLSMRASHDGFCLWSQVAASSQKAFLGSALCRPVAARSVQPFRAVRLDVAAAETERYRLHNLSPQKGSRRDEKRKGRGYGGHQGGTCGFGNRGQKARSGPSVRPGFEGGQTPLYRRLPKLRGIAGGKPLGPGTWPETATIQHSSALPATPVRVALAGGRGGLC
eukprot:GHUV01030995.1.p1 GENE.GHUV01030995.1~~GHUV01030995.1.p1  ORF type:complete len:183 (-),score=14.28 GHUV01030995.1:169-717(-)